MTYKDSLFSLMLLHVQPLFAPYYYHLHSVQNVSQVYPIVLKKAYSTKRALRHCQLGESSGYFSLAVPCLRFFSLPSRERPEGGPNYCEGGYSLHFDDSHSLTLYIYTRSNILVNTNPLFCSLHVYFLRMAFNIVQNIQSKKHTKSTFTQKSLYRQFCSR